MITRLTTQRDGSIALHSPYDPGFVAAFKATVSGSSRRWDPDSRVWLIDPGVAGTVADLCARYFGARPAIPTPTNTLRVETRILEVRYIGMTKDRGGDDRSAFGYADGSWSVLFSERVLMEWFCAIPAQPGEQTTLFGVLGIGRDADAAVIKTAYRRLAFQWHPDVCHEPNAAEMFKTIANAYQTLSDDTKRRKYLAGMALEASLATNAKRDYTVEHFGYRSPLRCGLILSEGTARLGVFNVSKITMWEDVIDSQVCVLVTSWPAGATMFEEEFV